MRDVIAERGAVDRRRMPQVLGVVVCAWAQGFSMRSGFESIRTVPVWFEVCCSCPQYVPGVYPLSRGRPLSFLAAAPRPEDPGVL